VPVLEEQTKARAEGRLVGIGIATYAELTGIGSRISAAPGMPITRASLIRLFPPPRAAAAHPL
jgi:hypothetical protein